MLSLPVETMALGASVLTSPIFCSESSITFAQPTEPAAVPVQPVTHHWVTWDPGYGHEDLVQHTRLRGRRMVERSPPRVCHLVALARIAAHASIGLYDSKAR